MGGNFTGSMVEGKMEGKNTPFLAGGFKDFSFSSLPGEMIQFD